MDDFSLVKPIDRFSQSIVKMRLLYSALPGLNHSHSLWWIGCVDRIFGIEDYSWLRFYRLGLICWLAVSTKDGQDRGLFALSYRD